MASANIETKTVTTKTVILKMSEDEATYLLKYLDEVVEERHKGTKPKDGPVMRVLREALK